MRDIIKRFTTLWSKRKIGVFFLSLSLSILFTGVIYYVGGQPMPIPTQRHIIDFQRNIGSNES